MLRNAGSTSVAAGFMLHILLICASLAVLATIAVQLRT
jgi:hypothetical protein